ncbi:Virulence sensor protein BvgS precursor [compost metagenome]
MVDALRFKQILSNLVSNAIKFTEEGFVKIAISGQLDESSQISVRVTVEDSGMGISPADRQRLFRPFMQLQRNVRNTEGAGLGLVICRSLCEMMGGQMSMSSQPGQGTRVGMELRLQVLERISAAPVPLAAAPRQRLRLQVLVVDDHQVNRQVLHQQLSFLGHDVTEADNGQVAFERWREQPFDLIITDCHMPVMTGSQLAQAIRRIEGVDAQEPTVIIGLTADAQPEEIELCIQAGMNDCLIKPIGMDELDARLLALQQGNEIEKDQNETVVTAESSATPPNLVDLRPLEQLISNEPVKFRQILDELINNNRRDREVMTVLLQGREYEKLADLAHRIKGAARVVKGEQLVERCRELEAVCLDPQLPFEQLERCVEQVRDAIAALEQALLVTLAH